MIPTTSTPTPRTDAVMHDPMRDGNDLCNLARTLERENAELLEALEGIESASCKKWEMAHAANYLRRQHGSNEWKPCTKEAK